jgi:Zn-dependent membrane protease YugP
VTVFLWLLLLAPLGLGLVVQRQLQTVFARYQKVPNHGDVTGAQVARALLDAHGLAKVRIESTPGELTDHYDGEQKVLRLSQVVGGERSVAAIGIAAHEVGHALQDAERNGVYRARKAVGEPIAAFAPWSFVVFIGGFWLGIPLLMVLSIAFAAGLALFAIVTVPVELGASRRAVELLQSTGLTDPREAKGVRTVLRAAAMTYFVGVVAQLGWLVALVATAEAARQVAT